MKLVRDNVAAMVGYTPGEQPTDPAVVKLNTNENPYPPSPRVMEAVRGVTAEQLRRYPSPDARVFREAAAKVHGVSPEMIVATNGGDELLALVARACAGENDRIAFLDPSYSLYPVLAAMQGARQIILPYRIDGTAWSLPEGIEETDAAVLLIVNPNAPSGTLVPVGRLSEIASRFRGVLLIDEAYVDFAPATALELAGKHSNVVILRSMSKGYGLAGMRFGYGIGPVGLIKELEKIRDSYACDAVSIAAATAAILDQDYARGNWEKVRAERARVTQTLRGLNLSIPESQSNFILAQIADGTALRGVVGGEVGVPVARQLYETLKARNILVRYFNLPRLTDKLRITIGTPEQNDRLISELQKLLGK